MTPTGTRSMVGALRAWADREPDRPALTVDDLTLSRAQLRRRVNSRARQLVEDGVTAGDLVTIALPNGHAFLEFALGALALGAVPQPVSSRLPDRELTEILALARPAAVIGVEEAERPGPDAFDDADLPDLVSPSWKAPTSGGSTGRPKLIVSTGAATIDLDGPTPWDLPADDVVVVPGPLYHNAPFSLSVLGLSLGDHIVLQSRFDAARTLDQVARYRASSLYLVPTMMHRIWRLGAERRAAADLGSLRTVQHTAAACPEWLKLAWIDWLGAERLREGYGGTEQQALTAITGPEWLERRGSVGRVVAGEMRILDPDGAPVPVGEVGEIFMRPAPGAGPTYRYIGATPRRHGDWESLGDLGRFDADGYLYLADRRTDLILSGGANIYPAEVEAAIDEHPAVGSSVVVGLPDEDLGQRAHAIVQVSSPVEPAELLAFLAERLVRYKHPRSFAFVTEPLRDDAGKVRRSALRPSLTDPQATV